MEGQTLPSNKLKFFESKRKLKVTQNVIDSRCQKMIASANNNGLLVIGCEDQTIKGIRTDQLLDFNQSKGQSEIVNVDQFVFIHQLSFRPTLLTVARYGYSSILLVAGVQNYPVIEVYDLDLQNPVGKLELNEFAGAEIVDYAWHPNYFDSIVALCSSKGHLIVVGINKKDRGVVMVYKNAQYGALTCCWSPKGKNLAVGMINGCIFRLEPIIGRNSFTFKEVDKSKLIFSHPKISPDHQVVKLRWVNKTFLLSVHAKLNNPNGSDTIYSIITVKPSKPYLYWTNICFENQVMSNYVVHLANFTNSVICATSAASEAAVIGVLGLKETTTNELNDWNSLIIDEEGARIELPLDANNRETFPRGLTTAFIKNTSFQEVVNRPILIFLTSDGLICPYAAIHSEDILKLPEFQPSQTFEIDVPIQSSTLTGSAFGGSPSFAKGPTLGGPATFSSGLSLGSLSTGGFSSGGFGAAPSFQNSLAGLQSNIQNAASSFGGAPTFQNSFQNLAGGFSSSLSGNFQPINLSTATPVSFPQKSEPVKIDPPKLEPSKLEPSKLEPTKFEPTKSEPAKLEPAKFEQAKIEPTKPEPSRLELTKTEPARLALTKTEPASLELTKTEPARLEPTRTEPTKLDSIKDGTKVQSISDAESGINFEDLLKFPQEICEIKKKLDFNEAYLTIFDELNHLRDRLDEVHDIHSSHQEALYAVKEDIHALDLEMLETLYLIEYIKTHRSKKKSIDPITLKKLEKMKMQLKQIEQKLEELNDHVDVAWEDFVRRKNALENKGKRINSLDVIYRTLVTNQKVINVLKKKVVVPTQSITAPKRPNQAFAFSIQRKEVDHSKFKEILALRNVVPVRRPVKPTKFSKPSS